MSGRLSCILLAALLLALTAIAIPAFADETYGLNQDFHRYDSNIVIHLLYVNVTDQYMGNIYPSTPPQNTKWAHLVYTYENTGDQMEVGNIQYELIDTQGRVYKFNPDGTEYSGAEVQPHSTTNLLWNEIPVPKDAVLAQVHVFEGTNPSLRLADETYNLTGGPSSTAQATTQPSAPVPSTFKFGCCAPLLPFILIGSLAIVGIYTRGRGIKK